MRMPIDLLQRASRLPSHAPFESQLRKYVDKQQQRQKRNYDVRHAVRGAQFSPGQHVYVRRDIRPDKLTPKWNKPQEIASVEGRSSVRLQDGSLRAYADIAPAAAPQQPAELYARPTYEQVCPTDEREGRAWSYKRHAAAKSSPPPHALRRL